MQRYFAEIRQNNVFLNEDDIHHVLHVMRMNKGDQIEVVDNKTLYLCEIISINPIEIVVKNTIPSNVELKNNVTLYFALAKGDKIDTVIQKCTELGVFKIVLFSSSRCVVKFEQKDINKKLERYQKIAKEASEQSHRLVIPKIEGVLDIKNITPTCERNFLAYEKKAGDTSSSFNDLKDDESISLIVGPEGGFSIEEVSLLKDKGFEIISLGSRILRTETAAIYGMSVLSYLLEK